MSSALRALVLTAMSIGLVHTLIGPDHYVPFVALAKARGWSMVRTMSVTFVCGLGHVLGSVVLGLIGIGFGVALARVESVEAVRGSIAAWILVGFGLVYSVWGTFRARRDRPHVHWHTHVGHVHGAETHDHDGGSVREAGDGSHRESTPWVLFLIFVFGPCEPLIPLLMYPAANLDIWGLAIVTGAFGFTTIATMLAMVVGLTVGVGAVPLRGLGRYGHALAGATILVSGIAIVLGL